MAMPMAKCRCTRLPRTSSSLPNLEERRWYVFASPGTSYGGAVIIAPVTLRVRAGACSTQTTRQDPVVLYATMPLFEQRHQIVHLEH